MDGDNMKDDMPLLRRTCATWATCCSYSGSDCLIMVSFIVPGSDARQPLPNEVCGAHQTHAQDRSKDAAIAAFWLTLGNAAGPAGRPERAYGRLTTSENLKLDCSGKLTLQAG
jgi:hypothetical protein